MKIQFLPMTIFDLEKIINIEQQSHLSPWKKYHFESSLNANHWSYVLWKLKSIFKENIILGYIVLMPILDEIHLLNITVSPFYQRKGFGKKILEETERLVRKQSITSILLEVRESNNFARKFYIKFGFQYLSIRKNYYLFQGKRENAIIMKKTL